jgi:uncharacterized protein
MFFQVPGTNVRLLGSLHNFPESKPELPTWVSTAYEWADAIVFEADLPTVLPHFKSRSRTSLRTRLTPEVWVTLKSIWPSTGPLAPLREINPWAALLLAPAFCQQITTGVDPQLLQWATEEAKPTSFLETAQEFAHALASVPMEEVRSGLELFASDLSAPQRMLEELHAAWIVEDLAGVYSVASKSPSFAFPGLRSAVLETRNRAWMPAMKAILRSARPTLVVVGALHLYGPANLVECLGLQVERIPTDG